MPSAPGAAACARKVAPQEATRYQRSRDCEGGSACAAVTLHESCGAIIPHRPYRRGCRIHDYVEPDNVAKKLEVILLTRCSIRQTTTAARLEQRKKTGSDEHNRQ